MDQEKYMDKDFDPQSLKVPEIRNILVKHGINYNATAKKDELVSIFNEQVKPLAVNGSLDGASANLSTISPLRKIKNKKSKKKSTLKLEQDKGLDSDLNSEQPMTSPIMSPNNKDRSGLEPIEEVKFSPKRKTKPKASAGDNKDTIFSDDNPFQSGPESAKKRSREDSEALPKKIKKKKKPKVRRGDSFSDNKMDTLLETSPIRTEVSEQILGTATADPFRETTDHILPQVIATLPIVSRSPPVSPTQDIKSRLRSSSNAAISPEKAKVPQLDSFPELSASKPIISKQEPSPRASSPQKKVSNRHLPPTGSYAPVVKATRSSSIASPVVQHSKLLPQQAPTSARTRMRRATDVDESLVVKAQSDYKNMFEKRRLSHSKLVAQTLSSPKIPESVMAIDAANDKEEIDLERSSESKRKRSVDFHALVRITLTMLMLAFVWRQNAFFNAGYFGSKFTSNSIAVDVPPFPERADTIINQANGYLLHFYSIYVEPIKLNCPEHATCLIDTALPKFISPNDPRDSILTSGSNTSGDKQQAVLQCDSGYIVHYPFKISSLVFPVPPICVQDKDTNTRIQEMVDLIVTKMQYHRGSTECNSHVNSSIQRFMAKINNFSFKDAFKQPTSFDWSLVSKTESEEFDDPDQIMVVGMHDKAVKSMIRPLYPMPETEFEYLFSRAINKLANDSALGIQLINLESESTTTTDNSDNEESDENDSENLELWLIANKSIYPILCRFRLVFLFIASNYIFFGMGFGVLAYILYLSYRRVSHTYQEAKRVAEIVEAITNILKLVSKYHYLDPVLAPHTNVLIDQVADYVFFGSSSEENPLYNILSKPKSYNLDNLADLAQISSNPDLFSFPIANYYDPRTRQRAWEKAVSILSSSEHIKVLHHNLDSSDKVAQSWEWIGPISLDSSENENENKSE